MTVPKSNCMKWLKFKSNNLLGYRTLSFSNAGLHRAGQCSVPRRRWIAPWGCWSGLKHRLDDEPRFPVLLEAGTAPRTRRTESRTVPKTRRTESCTVPKTRRTEISTAREIRRTERTAALTGREERGLFPRRTETGWQWLLGAACVPAAMARSRGGRRQIHASAGTSDRWVDATVASLRAANAWCWFRHAMRYSISSGAYT